jgi:hypothetical protein
MIDEEKKFKGYYFLLEKWIKLNTFGYEISEFFMDRELSTVGIYGMQAIGEILHKQLEKCGIRIAFLCDQNPSNVFYEANIIYPKDITNCDAIVVTPFYSFDEIEKMLVNYSNAEIISIEEIIYCLYEKYFEN